MHLRLAYYSSGSLNSLHLSVTQHNYRVLSIIWLLCTWNWACNQEYCGHTMSENHSFEEPDLGLWATVLFNTSDIINHKRPKSDGPNLGLFAKLPVEIREQIWQHFMPEHNLFRRRAYSQIVFRTAVSVSENWLAILRASRPLHAEMSEMLYRRRTLQVRIHPNFGQQYRDEEPIRCMWEVERKINRLGIYSNPEFFSRFEKMSITVWVDSSLLPCCRESIYISGRIQLNAIKDSIIHLASVLAKSEKPPKLEVGIRYYNLVEWDHKDLSQPSYVVSPDNDVRALLYPILPLERIYGAVQVRSVPAVENLRMDWTNTVIWFGRA